MTKKQETIAIVIVSLIPVILVVVSAIACMGTGYVCVAEGSYCN